MPQPDPELDYLKFFHWVTLMGITCGMENTVQNAIQAWRTPGASLNDEYYESISKHIPRYLCECWEADHLAKPVTVDEVIEWADKGSNDMMVGFFDPWREAIEAITSKNPPRLEPEPLNDDLDFLDEL